MIHKLRKAPRIAARRLSNAIRLSPARARAWWVRNVVRGPVWFTDRYGVTCRLYPADYLEFYFSGRLLFDDEGILIWLGNYLKPGMTVFDVGAGIGAFTLYAARRIVPGGCIHAFEPASSTYTRLQENLAHTPEQAKFVTANHAAIFNNDGEVTLNLFPEERSTWNWNSIGAPCMSGPGGKTLRPSRSEQVPARSLDSYCAQHHISHIDVLKIDVEGFEVEVAEGASALLRDRRVESIIFEVSLAPLEGTGRSGRDVIQHFVQAGLEVSLFAPDGSLIPIPEVARFEPPDFGNYLAVPRRSTG